MRNDWALVISGMIVASGCGSERPERDTVPHHSAAPAIVRAETGGTVQATSSELVIPALALTVDTEVKLSVEPLSSFPALTNGRPDVLVIEPQGTLLSMPATISVEPSLVGEIGNRDVSIVELTELDGARRWATLEGAAEIVSGGGLSIRVTRFAPIAIVLTEPVVIAPVVGSIEGRVSWSDGSAASGAPVVLLRDEQVVLNVTSGNDGTFRFGNLSAGTYVVSIDYECIARRTVTVTDGELAEVAIVLCGS